MFRSFTGTKNQQQLPPEEQSSVEGLKLNSVGGAESQSNHNIDVVNETEQTSVEEEQQEIIMMGGQADNKRPIENTKLLNEPLVRFNMDLSTLKDYLDNMIQVIN